MGWWLHSLSSVTPWLLRCAEMCVCVHLWVCVCVAGWGRKGCQCERNSTCESLPTKWRYIVCWKRLFIRAPCWWFPFILRVSLTSVSYLKHKMQHFLSLCAKRARGLKSLRAQRTGLFFPTWNGLNAWAALPHQQPLIAKAASSHVIQIL